MRYRKLGRWGVRVSEVGLGSWLTYGGAVEEDTAIACIHRAYERGVNFFDTANVYALGRAELVVGKALADFQRDTIVVATKVFHPMSSRDHPYPNDRGLSRKHVLEQCDASLRRLGLDYIDLYQCHRYDTSVPLEETCQAMNDLVRAGNILYWGVSEWTADQIAHAVSLCRANGWAEPVSNQPQYSALWRRPEAQVFPTCEDLGLGNVVWSPLAMGVLTGKYTSVEDVPDGSRAAGPDGQFMRAFLTQEVLDAVQRLRFVADEAGCSLTQLALAWCLREPTVSSAIVGATRVEHADEAAEAGVIDVSDDVLAAVDDILAPVAIE
jgi:voltage-dependent potassium channel beta subunit